MKYKTLFSYYGGKGRLAHLYPSPRFDVIIEPFAGGASYSLMHPDLEIKINDLDNTVYNIWSYVLSHDLDSIMNDLPVSVEKGDRVSEIVDIDVLHPGAVALLRSITNQQTQGLRGTWEVFTTWGARDYSLFLKKLEYWHPKIRHWKITNNDYKNLWNQTATWFIDPPYSNDAGRLYRTDDVDYDELSEFVKRRYGQTIVCDSSDATWLEFEFLTKTRSSSSKGLSKGTTNEGVYLGFN